MSDLSEIKDSITVFASDFRSYKEGREERERAQKAVVTKLERTVHGDGDREIGLVRKHDRLNFRVCLLWGVAGVLSISVIGMICRILAGVWSG